MLRRAILVGLAGCSLTACASYPNNQTITYTNCATNLAAISYANNLASDLEDAAGQDVDAFDQGDRDMLWFSLARVGLSALTSGRKPGAVDACHALNDAADHVTAD